MARCNNCNKKAGLIVFDCRCEGTFCRKCSFPEVHKCDFDIKLHQKNLLKQSLVKVSSQKIEKI